VLKAVGTERVNKMGAVLKKASSAVPMLDGGHLGRR
jgi:hypothetical protein